MAPEVSWVWGEEEWAPIGREGEVGGVWEGFGDEVEDE